MKHLIVVSVDALVYEDLKIAEKMPNFATFLNGASVIKRAKTIYPSLTHPAHATIMSGCTPAHTSITANTEFDAGNLDPTWFNKLGEMKCETIFHAAKRYGLTTCACRWPVTANGADVIDYLVPEIMGKDVEDNEQATAEVYRKTGASENVMDIIEDALSKFGGSIEHPIYDDFQIYCAAQIIKKYKPNILFTHPGYVDCKRHMTGLFSESVSESIAKTDEWLGQLWEAVCDAGIENETDFVILSDHGHLNYSRVIRPNVYLADAGYIKTDDNGNITDWKAYCMSCGLSAQVFVSDKSSEREVYDLLKRMADEGIYGFERVFTKDEVSEKYGLDGDFSFVIETDGVTSFEDNWERPLVVDCGMNDYKENNSNHGHLPEKGPQPVFIAKGPSFKEGVIAETGSVLDYAPTFAKILGIDMEKTDGKVMVDFIR